MICRILISFFFLLPTYLTAQIVTGKFGIYNYMAHVPPGTGKMPTIIFIPGQGESNTDVNKLYLYGPMGKIRDGKVLPMAVYIAIQPHGGGPASWQWTANMLDSIFATEWLRADPNRYSLTGLSNGGHTIYTYMRSTPDNRYRPPASIVAMSAVVSAGCGDFYQNTDHLCGTDFRWATVPAWGICGSQDSFFGKQKRFWERMQQAGYQSKWTTLQGWGHSGWAQLYDPTWKIDGENVYEFMLKWVVGGVLPVKLGELRSTSFGLTWSTMQEQNASHFTIEQSTDGLIFKPVGEVKAKGESQTKQNYNWKWKD